MRKINKEIIRFLKWMSFQSRCIINTWTWLIKNALHENFCNYIPKVHRKDKLYIMGNGPSLKDVIFKPIFERDLCEICVVNDFARFPVFSEIKPEHYVLADPFYFMNFENERNKSIHRAFQLVTWQMSLYVPFTQYKKIKNIIDNIYINIIPFHACPYNGWKWFENKLYKSNLSMPRPQNVVIPAIFIGINNGFKEIYLYGVDHSWTEELRVNQNNEVCFLYEHFFDKNKPALKPWHRGTNLPVYKMHEILRDLAWMFESYQKLREYAEIKGCRIINCTSGSYIDAFERKGTEL